MAILRKFFIWLDTVAFGFIDNAYNLILGFATGSFVTSEDIRSIINNMYIIVGIFALFRIAMLLINSLIDPDRLSEKGKGLGNILVRTVIMLVILFLSPFLFNEAFVIQEKVMEENIIPRLIIGTELDGSNYSAGENAGKELKNIALSALISVNKNFVDKITVNSNSGLPVDADVANSLGVPADPKDGMDINGNTKDEDDRDIKETEIEVYLLDYTDSSGIRHAGYLYNDKCVGNCTLAISAYNQMYANGDLDVFWLAKYINTKGTVTAKDADGNETTESEYIYDYMVLLTTATGVFITYVLFSFALDLAIRVFELTVLQVLAPLFIVTFIDPKSASSGPFNKWLKAVGNSYAGLFIRVAVVCFVIFLVSWINQYNVLDNPYFKDQSSLAKLILIWGLLAFAKKAPKWIGDMIGIQSDGLGGLGIGKKLVNSALGGALLAKGAKGLAGASVAGAKSLTDIARNRREQRKKNPELFTRSGRKAARNKRALDFRNDMIEQGYVPNTNLSKWAKQQARKEQKDALKQAKSDAKLGTSATAAQIGSALFNGVGAFSAAAKADKLSGSLKVGNDRANSFKDKMGLEGDSSIDRFKNWSSRQNNKMFDTAFGDEGARYERADKLAKEKTLKRYHNKEFIDSLSEEQRDVLINGMGKFSGNIVTDNGVTAHNINAAKAIYAAKVEGKSTEYKDGKLYIDGKEEDIRKPENYYVSKAQNMLSGSGKVHFLDMFNKTQGNCANEFETNGKAINDLSSTIGALENLMKGSISKMSSEIGKLGDTFKNKLTFEPSTGALQVQLDDKKLNLNSTNLEELKNVDNSLYDELLNSGLLASIKQRDTYSRTIYNKNVEMNELITRQDQIKGNVEGISIKVNNETGLVELNSDESYKKDASAFTLAGKQAAVARNADSIGKMVAAADEKDKQEGKA